MIRLLIMDKPHLFCHAMRAALQRVDDMYVVSCAANSEEAQPWLAYCDVLLVSGALHDQDRVQFIQTVAADYPSVKVLVVGVSEQEELILRYVEAGATGYVLPQENLEALLHKIRAAHRGEALISPRVAACLMTRLAELAHQRTAYSEQPQLVANLTRREYEVLRLIGAGFTNRRIAEDLVIECGTVKNHVHRILKKLKANNRREAAAVYRSYAMAGAAYYPS